MTQLTITLPDDLAQRAKAYARETGRSLDSLLEEYLTNLLEAYHQTPPVPPQAQRVLGSFKMPENIDYKQIMTDALQEQHDT